MNKLNQWLARALCWIGPFVVIMLAVPAAARGQEGVSPSLEVGLGLGRAGHGAGLSGKLLGRVLVSEWGIGVRLMRMDGERRRATSCFIFCEPIESFTEKSALLYRTLAPGGYRIYAGAGVGLLTGRRFIGSSTELDRDVSELGFSFDLAIHVPPGSGFRFVPSAYGHVGAGGLTAGFMVGVALAG